MEALKKAGINIHIMATGAGAGLQNKLWEIPGSSAYLSGASFPYDQFEQEELLGFMPEHFCSMEAAVDLASAAYMKAYKYGGNKPVGVGITASVASEVEHRGDHRFFVAVMTDTKVLSASRTLKKGVGIEQRREDGERCNGTGLLLLLEALDLLTPDMREGFICQSAIDLAKDRFFAHPYFLSDGRRVPVFTPQHLTAIMPGAYNPPHEGHFGIANTFEDTYGNKAVFQITINPPHKEELTVQHCLKRAKMLRGKDRLFTRNDPLYLDKARRYPNTPIIVGADALLRMFDPKWGVDIGEALKEFNDLGTRFFVTGRAIDSKFVELQDALATLPQNLYNEYWRLFIPLEGRWDISSTELRNK